MLPTCRDMEGGDVLPPPDADVVDEAVDEEAASSVPPRFAAAAAAESVSLSTPDVVAVLRLDSEGEVSATEAEAEAEPEAEAEEETKALLSALRWRVRECSCVGLCAANATLGGEEDGASVAGREATGATANVTVVGRSGDR